MAIPVIKYIFNIINWTIPEIRRLDMKACNRMHHLKVDANRIYIPRNEGRRGMIWLNWASTIGQHKYLRTKTYWMLQLVLTNDKTKKLNWISARPSASVTLPFTYPHILTLLTSNSLLSMMIASLALVIQLSLTIHTFLMKLKWIIIKLHTW